MLLNRRAMFQASIGAIALSLTGCNNTKTDVNFVNAAGLPVTVDALANGVPFKKKNIQPGHSVTHTFKTNDQIGSKVKVTGSVTIGEKVVDLAKAKLAITLGKLNTILVNPKGKIVVYVA